MTEIIATQLKAIPFERDIERLTTVFIGRTWVFKEIDLWLQQENERFFILTGEPGLGKSAIAARLTQIRDDVAAYHFCRAGDVETVRPGRILRSLAAQLGKHLPDYGHALANTIKPVHLRIEVNINIGSMTGSEVTGVYIENLKESDPENELDILIRAPLEELQRMYAERQQTQPALAIILIDSLDEAVTTTGTNLVKLLTQLSKSTSLPSWVRFVMTSRPERRVLRGFEPLKPYQLQEKSDESLSDIRRYVNDRVAQPALQNCLQVNQVQPQTLISEITNLSHGNFLYTTLLLNDIEAGRQALDNLAALPKSIDDIYHGFLSRFSEEDWSDRYKPIFGVLTVALEPISEKQISNFTKIDSEDVRDSIRIARQFFDVETDEQNKEIYSIFHQSLRDYLLDEGRNLDFWCDALKQHQKIITFYERTSKSWQELERIDSYGRNYLAQHLVKGDRVEELHTLLSLDKDGKNAWFKVKDDEGDTAGFLADVELAWSQADEACNREPGKSIGLQCRYALIKASINSLAEIPAELMIALVKHKFWKPTKALAYTRQITNPETRFNSLIALAEQLPDADLLKNQVLQFALQAAQAIQFAVVRARVLTDLADKLPEVVLQALEAVLAIQSEYFRAPVLTALADKLTPELVPKALEAALTIQNEFDRGNALTGLAQKLPELLPQALEAALMIQDERDRAYLLMNLAGKLTPELLPKALEAVQAIQEESVRSTVLMALAGKLPEESRKNSAPLKFAQSSNPSPLELLPQTLKVAQAIQDDKDRVQLLSRTLKDFQAIQDESPRAHALTVLADRLPEILPQALEAALAIQGASARAYALTALADRLPEILPQALEAALAIQDRIKPHFLRDKSMRAQALMSLVGKLTPDLLSQALEAALATQDGFARAQALTALADRLPEALHQALEAALAIQNERERANTLTALADKLTPELLPRALEAVQLIQSESYSSSESNPWQAGYEGGSRARGLRVLTSRILAEKQLEVLPKALDFALTIQNEADRAQVLTALADKLPEALPQALEAALAIQFEFERAQVLRILAEKLTPELLPQALEAARSIQSEYYRAQVLRAMADKLPILLPESLEVALAIRGESARVHALTALADKIPEALPKALEATLAIQVVSNRAQALRAMAGKLTPELLPKALEATLAIQERDVRDEALSQVVIALADKIPEALPQALEAVQTIEDKKHRVEGLTALAPHLINASNHFNLWKDLLHFLSYRTRPDLLTDIAALIPVIFALGKEAAVAETAQAIQVISRWWP